MDNLGQLQRLCPYYNFKWERKQTLIAHITNGQYLTKLRRNNHGL
jgi:hypothetical protein